MKNIMVPIELLERVASQPARGKADYELRGLLSAPSPAGAGGLEVIGWYTDDHLNDKSATTYSREVADRWLAKGWTVTGIANADDAQAIIDGLLGEVGAQRVKTCAALKARNDAREERDRQTQRIGALASHLEFAVTLLTVAGLAGNAQVEAMRAALSAGNEPKQCT